MSHNVKCSICSVVFDRDKIQAVRTGSRRYAHATCCPDNTDFVPLAPTKQPKKKVVKVENEDLKSLKHTIHEIFGDSINWAKVTKQINQYIKDYNYTYSGIRKTLEYFYQIKNNPIDRAQGGIGIVPFTYNESRDYFYKIFLANQANKNKKYTTQLINITITPPKSEGLKSRFFDLGEWDEK